MASKNKRHNPFRALLLGMGALFALAVTGCQVDVGGQSLPSPYYLTDDVQYFAPGPEFLLSREAAAMKTYNQEAAKQAKR
ncbi:MAG: hypothetical protein ACWGMZ_03770 [Thermoguttaceae bacterium]